MNYSPKLTRAVVVVITWWLGLQLPVQFVPITTKVVSLNSTHGEVYLKQHYLIKFFSDLRQVHGFLEVLRFPLPIYLTAMIWLIYIMIRRMKFPDKALTFNFDHPPKAINSLITQSACVYLDLLLHVKRMLTEIYAGNQYFIIQ